MTELPLIELQNVNKSYGTVDVLQNVNLDIRRNEFLVVVGPSGSGKTTVLRMIGGFVEPTRGLVLLDGRAINGLAVNRRPFNTVFQDYALFPHMTVAENIGYGLRIRKVGKAEIKRSVSEALSLVGLEKLSNRYPAQLSGGQRQRVALARAVICKPRLVLLDEPLAALDANLRAQMQGFLKNIQREIQTSFLFITHDQEEAISLADRICIMDHGAIAQIGTPKEVYYKPQSQYVANFFGDNNLLESRVLAIDGSDARVQTDFGFGSVAAAALNGQTAPIIAVRPENLELVAGQDAPTARVTEISFVGAFSVVTVQALSNPSKRIHVKRLSDRFDQTIQVGQELSVKWVSDNACVVRV